MSFPFLSIANRFGVGYGLVARYAEAVRQLRALDAEDRRGLALCWPSAAKATVDAVNAESLRRNIIENDAARLL
jgi:hypothetical protein